MFIAEHIKVTYKKIEKTTNLTDGDKEILKLINPSLSSSN